MSSTKKGERIDENPHTSWFKEEHQYYLGAPKGSILMANVHGHPDQSKSKSGGRGHDSKTDRELSMRMNVYAVEKDSIIKFKGGEKGKNSKVSRNANSILKDTLKDKYGVEYK